jgi:hypothetical protein
MKNATKIGDRDGGSWGAVRETKNGFVIEQDSRYQGSTTDTSVLVPFEAKGVPASKGDDLSEIDEQGVSLAENLAWFASRFPERCRVLRKGFVVR